MQTAVCASLRSVGIDHYDFKNPPNGAGFGWRDVKNPGAPVTPETTAVKGTDWETLNDYYEMVEHPRAVEGYYADFSAMEKADCFVLVLPCGKSAHLELGWAVGQGKYTAILAEDPIEPELMYRMVDYISPNLFDLLGWLGVED